MSSEQMMRNSIEAYLNDNVESLSRKYMQYHLRGITRGENIARKILPFVQNRNLKILDFGSGFGLVAFGISKLLHGTIKGTETKSESLEVARKWLRASSIRNITFKNIDISRMNEKFDLVIANDVLEHVPDRAKYLKILRDKLHAGGLLYIKTTNRLCLYNFLFDNHFKIPFVSILQKRRRNKIISFLSIQGPRTFDYSFKWELENLFKVCGYEITKDFRPLNYFLMAHEYLVKRRD